MRIASPLPDVPALAASMARLERRCAEAEAKKIPAGQAPDSAETVTEIPLSVAPLGDVPKVPRPDGLKWGKPKDMGVQTLCKRYSCCKVVQNGQTTYELWVVVPSGNWFNCISRGLESFEKARALAQGHVEGRR